MVCPICQNKKEENKHCKICANKLKENTIYIINKLNCSRAFLQGLGWDSLDKNNVLGIPNNAIYHEDNIRYATEIIDNLTEYIKELEWEIETKNKSTKPIKKVTPISKDNILVLPYVEDHSKDNK